MAIVTAQVSSSARRAISPWSATFKDRELERAYRKFAVDQNGRVDQLLMISGALILALYGFLDWMVLGDLASWTVANRAIASSLIAGCWILSYTSFGQRHLMWISAMTVVLATVCMMTMIMKIGSISPPYYIGLIHVGVMFSSVARINFRVCTSLLYFIIGWFLIATWGFKVDPAFVSGRFFVVGTLMSCAMGNYFLEYTRRQDFIAHREREQFYLQVQAMADEAEKSVKRKNALLNVLGHVVKTPLHQIIGYAQIIEQSDDLPEETRDTPGFAAEIHRAGVALSHQSQRILDYSRADAGLITSKPQRSHCKRMVREAIYRHEAMINEKKIALAVNCDETPVYADTRHIVRALDELIDNAIRYSPPGSQLRIESHITSAGVVLSIGDNGPGIPEGDIDHVGDALNRTEEFRNMGGDKLGIGVSLARTLVRIGGGKLYFSSIPDQGSLAQIVFPHVMEPDNRNKNATLAPLKKAS